MVAGAVGPLLVIVGPTASGKSALAVELAERFNGEIICADSRTVYKGMDIGTAKPSVADRARVPHHLLDLVLPNEPFSVAQFKKEADNLIDEITHRHKLPILVGGTGLYVDAVLYDYQFRAPSDTKLRDAVSRLSVAELQSRLRDQGIPLPSNSQNPRHLIRALETAGEVPQKRPLRARTLLIGLDPGKEVLQQRIAERVDMMLAGGFLDEAERLGQAYDWDCEALQTTGYKAAQGYILGTRTEAEVRAEFIRNDMQYAKRQRTWFKRNKSIHWFCNGGDIDNIVDLVTTHLNKV